MKKRIVSLLLVAILIASMLPGVVASATTAEITAVLTVEESWSNPGDTVDVNLMIAENPGILGATLVVSWDESLTLIADTSGKAFSHMTYTSPSRYTASGTNFVWFGNEVKEAMDGIVLTLTFEVPELSENNEILPIWVTYTPGDVVDGNDNDVTFIISEGYVRVITYKPGDVNGDTRVNSRDLVRLSQYISDGNKTDPEGYNAEVVADACDVNGDGRVNARDLIRLSQYISDGSRTDLDGYNAVLNPAKLLECTHIDMLAIEAKTPSCTDDGNIEYWYCTKCKKYFSDKAGTSEISLEDTIIQASGHTYSDVWSCDNDCHWHDPNCVHKDDENIELKDLSEHTYIDHKCSVCSHIEEFVVTFYDYDDTVLDIQMVAYGNGANEPEIPEHSGLGFDKWDQSFSYITGDTDVKAKYNHYYTVKFIDYDGSVLKTESVLEGHSATEPEIPERMGYTFNGWDKPFSNIVENTVVTAIYLQNKCTVQFVMPDGSLIEERENITYGSSLEEPANSDVFSEYYFDFANHTYNEFSGWNKSLKNITFDNNGDTLTFEAQYNVPYNQPVIALEIKNNDCLQASIYMPKSCYVYGIDFGFNWSDDIGITSYNLNENACPLYNPPQEEKGHPDEDVSVIYNNKTKSFEYIWMCGNGHTVTKAESTYIVLIEEIDFAISGDAKLNQEVISVLDSCSIFYSDHGHCTFEDLIQINPIVVVK